MVLDPAATLDTPDWLLFCHRHPLGRPRGRELLQFAQASLATEALSLQGLTLLTRALPAIKRNPAATSAPRLRGPARHVAGDRSLGLGRADRCQPRHRLCAGRRLRRRRTGTPPASCCPRCWHWNAAVNGERQKALSAAMGAPGASGQRADREHWCGTSTSPYPLRAVGIKRENLDEIARRALSYQPVQLNPRPIKTVEDVKEILELAW